MRHTAFGVTVGFALVAPTVESGEPLKDAVEIARWLTSNGRDVDGGRVWPIDPEKPDEVVAHLYSGTAGVERFFLEAHRLTGNPAYLEQARAGADYLVSNLPTILEVEGAGLYTGLAGVGFVLDETFGATGDEKYLEGVLRTVALLEESAQPKGKGVEWNDTTDVVGGSAGIGLFLLHLDLPHARALALRAGERLLERATETESGSKWAMTSELPRLMPNFSHGTAGVAYFLAALYEETGEKRFLDAALSGAEYLRSIADVTGDACLIFHNEPDGKDLYYLSWCHGPAGTARLFYQLFRVTNDPQWMKWVEMSARGVLASGIPEKRTPGFWNNISQCCGSAGVAEFFLSLHQVTAKREYLEFAERVSGEALSRATRDERGLRFVQAEHRTQPELLQAQTGYMQGAAGVGLWLLRLHAFSKGEKAFVVLPDSPFRS